MAFFEDVWTRNFINVFASPMLISEYLCGLILTGIATSLIGLLVMLLKKPNMMAAADAR